MNETTPPPPPAPVLAPSPAGDGEFASFSRIQDYELVEFLGEGATAHVYRAQRRRRSELDDPAPPVAIKVIDKLLAQQMQTAARIQRELVLHQQLQHRHIVRVEEVMEDARNYYLVLELCAQGSVAGLLRSLQQGKREDEPRAAMDEALAKKFFRQTVSAVQCLHDQGIIHRDLKLANLLLTEDLDVKLSDFGLATRVQEEHATVCGTPNFLAPEILLAPDGGTYDQAVDIWSLGCILFTMLLGYPPFEGRRVR